ncbi:DsbC family protein [Acinetobacter sp. MD2(2019)]|uniref:DsbC family protein n=1 Tax=Acinetobacter sp. MD2(2019) TaxID=2605273 RepID=UPI002D1F1CC2|nr:DsbC family protein [Acinetobacter sp. MD2(2019)]MEB3755038.1 DsbC family protein [Acinetobacter sp. MD2(2019)]
MFLRSSSLAVATLVAASTLLSACSQDNNQQKTDNTLTATAPATGQASPILERNAKQRLIDNLQSKLQKANINVKIVDIKSTEIPNIYWVNLQGMPSVYTTADGQYIIQGDVLRLGDKQLYNVSENLQAGENKKLLAALNPKDLIVYPSQGKTKHVIYVFTDANCPYCHKLHEHLPEINAKGIEVRYIAWPRGDQFFPAMEAIWCSADRKAAFTAVVQGQQLPSTQCNSPVKDQYQLGMNIGVNGTPAIYSEDGKYLGGYLSADEIEQRLAK